MKPYIKLQDEQGEQFVDGEYRFGSVGIGGRLELAPDVVVELVDESNQLCPSNYSDTMCFWEGLFSIQFKINDEIIRISDHDTRPLPITHGENVTGAQWSTFSIGPYIYRIIGTGSYVENKSRNQTYLKYRITKGDNSTAYYRLRHGNQYTDGRSD